MRDDSKFCWGHPRELATGASRPSPDHAGWTFGILAGAYCSMLTTRLLLAATAPWVTCIAQTPRLPNIEAQRAAMKKLEFLIGNWSGEARVLRGFGEPWELMIQTEEAHYK